MNYNNGETLTTSKNIIFVVYSSYNSSDSCVIARCQYTNQLATAQQMSHANNVTANSITNTTNMTYAARSTAKAQNVSIVPDASALDDKSYQPNPVNINIGDTIIWKNDDNIPITHTVTSGTVDADNAGMEFDFRIYGCK